MKVICDDLPQECTRRQLRKQQRKMMRFFKKLKKWEKQGKLFTMQYQNKPLPPGVDAATRKRHYEDGVCDDIVDKEEE